MPFLVAVVGGFIASFAGAFVARLFISLGIGVVSVIGMGVVIDFMIAQMVDSLTQLPATVLHLATLMKLDVAINIIIGSINARLGLVTLNGIVSRFQINPAAYQGS